MILRASICLLAILGATSALAEQQVDRRAAADADGSIEISVPSSAPSGKVVIRGWQRNEVHVSGEIDDDAVLDFSTQGKRTVIRVNNRERHFHSNRSTRLEVMVPASSRVNTVTVSADTRIEGVHGAQELRSVSGSIEAEFWQDDLDIHTVSGDVHARGHDAKSVVSISTVSGDAELSAAQGEVNGGTVSGNLRLRLGTLTRGRFNTTSGDIAVTATLGKDARVDLEATSGDIELRLPPPINAQFDIATFSGDIKNCFGPKSEEHEHGPGQNLYFTAGNGSARVKAKSLSGDIRICDR